MKPSIQAKLDHANTSGRYVRLSNDSMRKLNRLREAYGMRRYDEVVQYLVNMGVAGLEQAEVPEGEQ